LFTSRIVTRRLRFHDEVVEFDFPSRGQVAQDLHEKVQSKTSSKEFERERKQDGLKKDERLRDWLNSEMQPNSNSSSRYQHLQSDKHMQA
jgi:hypothetical protein